MGRGRTGLKMKKPTKAALYDALDSARNALTEIAFDNGLVNRLQAGMVAVGALQAIDLLLNGEPTPVE